MGNFHEYAHETNTGVEKSMSDYKGKPVLVLNVASL